MEAERKRQAEKTDQQISELQGVVIDISGAMLKLRHNDYEMMMMDHWPDFHSCLITIRWNLEELKRCIVIYKKEASEGKNTNNVTTFIKARLYGAFINFEATMWRHRNKTLAQGMNKRIYYFMIPTHGNLGDQFIVEATLQLLKKEFSDFEVVEVDDDQTYQSLNSIKSIINPNDIVILHGGGNMGDLYPTSEIQRRDLIKSFPKNQILIMTQTAFFSETSWGRKQLAKSAKVYNSHPNLTILAREQKSYDFMQEHFNQAKIVKVPDIVFGYEFEAKPNREYIMTLIRSDEESILSNPRQLLRDLDREYDQLLIYDNYVARRVDDINRQAELRSFIGRLMGAKVVITDRMHGMILCAITGTPCIVTKSLDDKILGSYEWIKDLNYIRLVDSFDMETIKNNVEELTGLDHLDKIRVKEQYLTDLRAKLGL